MPTPDTFWTSLSTISVYLVVLAVPGGLIGIGAGLRGWALAGLAPLFTYFSLGSAGPWLSMAGLPYNTATAAAFSLLLAGLAFGVRMLARSRGWVSKVPLPRGPHWTKRAHAAVIGCVLLATALSMIVVLSAADGASSVFQRWDTVYHANGIRYIAETGDGSLVGMSTINWYPDGSFYPNAYHLVGALVYSISGASIPAALNGITVPIAGIFALALAATIRQFGGRAAFAGSAAIVAGAATTGAYESVSSGLLPFALGIVLTPLAAVALQRFLTRPDVESGMVFALTIVGLLLAHSSALFGAILFTIPLLLQRWFRREGVWWRDLLRMVPAGLAALVLAAPQVLGAIAFTSSSYPYIPWASDIPVSSALAQLLTFRQVLQEPQMVLCVLLVAGILTARALGAMRWVAFSALLLSGTFVLVACYGALPWVISFSRPWWNDRYRLMSLAAIPLCLLAAHGLAELQRLLAKVAAGWDWVKARPRLPARIGVASAVLLVSVLAVGTNGFYTTANATAVAYAYHNGPESIGRPVPVTDFEVDAMREMGKFAVPGEKVLNDRLDGTAWLFAISGVRPVAGHYDPGVAPPDATFLSNHFREYDTNPDVRAAVERLNVRHVLLGSGSIKPDVIRAPGLRDLDGLPFLEKIYANPDAMIYRILR
ncbi:DUF6541 family protein [Amycolatopsis sp. 195334CR]|uniref:DUF6541 family protein n=1 Tax=Amycolatopsis sp. 195334CR TaxID=2814588 RepID=UPI001A8ECEE2|nr:DUF6541 family protein [Amycolatopsis sp. 195334CR]MBN6035352.1 copper-transporting ATPase [Amycolatopsis sp. 195334CR]